MNTKIATKTRAPRIDKVVESTALPVIHAPAKITPADMVVHAMKNGGSIDQLREFMLLQREWEAGEAKKAFVAAMVEFKKNPPVVVKDKKVGFVNNDGVFVGYTHASLGNLNAKIIKALADHGFSHEWKSTQEDGKVRVTCIITHHMGHSESNWLESAPDETGKKGNIQRIGSAVTFLQRYTLQGATGIATVDDDDGLNADPKDLETALADRWIGLAVRAADIVALEKVYNDGIADIAAKGTDYDKQDFISAVNARKAKLLTPKDPNKSSRLSGIVGASQQAKTPAE